MTPLQKRCQELLPVIQAGAEGKAIECATSEFGTWTELKNPYSNDVRWNLCYRIKTEPKYRPFTPEEAARHLGRRVNHKFVHASGELTAMTKTAIKVGGDAQWQSYAQLACNYVFADDGTPCGVLIEDT